MILLPGGTYGALGRQSNLPAELVQFIQTRLERGEGITAIRTAARLQKNIQGGQRWRFTNQAASQVKLEVGQFQRLTRAISKSKGSRVLPSLPARWKLAGPDGVKVWQYHAVALVRNKETGEITEVPIIWNSFNQLTKSHALATAKGIARQVVAKGGPGSDMLEAELVSVRITAVLHDSG